MARRRQALGETGAERAKLEWNARRILTVWSPTLASGLRDYAWKEWSGLLTGFYAERWAIFFRCQQAALDSGKPFDQGACQAELFEFENEWCNQHEAYPSKPKGDSIEVAQRLFDKYIAGTAAPKNLMTGKPMNVSRAAEQPATSVKLRADRCAVSIDAHGMAGDVEYPDGKVLRGMAGAVEVRYGTKRWPLSQPTAITHSGDAAGVEYELPAEPKIHVGITYRLQAAAKAVVLAREVAVRADARLKEDLTLSLPNWPARLPADTWLPLPNGTGGTLSAKPAGYDFQGPLSPAHTGLSVPMATYQDADGRRVTVGSDPYFSTLFAADHLEWTYPKNVGLEDAVEKRRFVSVVHDGPRENALDAYYRYALPDVPPGPPWLHEIAMVDYDYMSEGGKGWFKDIDALAAALSPAERPKVFLCLHGWYDWCGRYSFDAKAKQFDKQWTAFGNAPRYQGQRKSMNIDGQSVDCGFAMCRQVPLTTGLLRQRLAYARSRGFRVGLYFADGMNAGTGLPGYSSKLVLKGGGWVGPDTSGDSYCMNPLAPEVHEFFLAYTDALLREFGNQVDALVWDETAMVGANTYGSAEVPGYSTRAMMRLVREVAGKVETYNSQTAFLTSDCAGIWGTANFAMVAHGTYQDSWCQPHAWSPGTYPNWRNTLWSCCWWPVHKQKWIEFAVRNYQAPVAISNGWGDNVGFAEMSPEMRKKVIELFRWRAKSPARMKLMESLPAYK